MEHTQSKQGSLTEAHIPNEVEWERVSRRFIPRLFLQRLFWAVFVLVLVVGAVLPIILTVGNEYFAITMSVLGVLCFLVLASVSSVTALDYRFRGFALRESDLLIKKGVIFRSEFVVPFSRIQDIREDSGVVDRMFSLRTLYFFTAGGQSPYNKKIDGCNSMMANTIRQFTMGQVVCIVATQFNPNDEVESQKSAI
ncbi:MAG: PH domain-containing protein [Gammaproteobacteria bacterium]|nr:PH domain-containing protein [Gammaproteobacteria bacterium]